MSIWVVTQHIIKYYSSIRQFGQFYLSLIYKEDEAIPLHYTYLCPLCLKNYILYENDRWSCSVEFSLDHYPPKNVGGTETVLVCKPCNNKAGHAYEPVLEEYINMISFNKRIPNSPVKIQTVLTDVPGWYRGEIGIDEKASLHLDLQQRTIRRYQNKI